MRYRKLSSNGDYTFGNGQLNFYRNDPLGVAQAVVTRLRLWAGEWFLDLVEGTPYQINALGKHTAASADPMIRDRILNTEGVTAILAYDSYFDADNRIFHVSVTIETLYGTAQINEVL